MTISNPIVAGFNPDPSICRVDDWFYLVTSTFEYLPGLPVYRSRDLTHWSHIGNVATRQAQLRLEDVEAEGGVFAPTIRYHDGLFYVITTSVPHRWNVVFTAADPGGPWTDGIELPGITGIDPDLCWDEQGDAYVTYAGVDLSEGKPRMLGIVQAQVDLNTGERLTDPQPQFQGTGLKFPEGPHVIRRGDHWYLLLAEGGTERGHAVSIARSTSHDGPWEPCPHNPILTHAGHDGPIQNTGHADLVEGPGGQWHLVCLGVRTGPSQRFAPLGRETFLTTVEWVDDWPVVAPVELGPAKEDAFFEVTSTTGGLDDPGWISARREPASFARVDGGDIVLSAADPSGGEGLDHLAAAFLGRRQPHRHALLRATVHTGGAPDRAGGLALRNDEHHHISLIADDTGRVTARGRVRGLEQSWSVMLPPDLDSHAGAGGDGDAAARAVDLALVTRAPSEETTFDHGGLADIIELYARATVDREWQQVASLDGRYWAMEVGAFMTGRVTGLLATRGTVRFSGVQFASSDTTVPELS